MNLNPLEVKQRLNQKTPFQMVDKVENFIDKESCVAIKAISANDPFFNGHFPDFPVMPGVMVIEAAAQACSIIMGKCDDGCLPALVTVENFKLTRPIIPGDVMKINCKKSTKSGTALWIFNIDVKVNDVVCARGELTFMNMPIDKIYAEK